MPYIRKVRSGRSIHLAVSSCTTTRCCFVGYAACRSLGAILEALGGVLCKILHPNFAEFPLSEGG
jgi:hypothetical protein